ITHVLVIDGTGKEVKKDQTVIFSNGIIQKTGDSKAVTLPKNAYEINGQGKTLIPGLVMLHEHMYYPIPFDNFFSVREMPYTFPRLYLAGGVTTMRTGGSIEPQTDVNIKNWINQGKMTGPKIDASGPYIEREGMDIPEIGFIHDPKQATELVNYWADRGVTSFKMYMHATKEDLANAVAAAHKHGMKITGHLCSITYAEASNLGIDDLEHGFMASSDFVTDKSENECSPDTHKALSETDVNDPRVTELIDLLIKNHTAITTTPNVFEPFTGREIVPGGGFESLIPQLQEKEKSLYDRVQNKNSASLAMFNKNLVWLKRFYEKGGLLVAGTDPTGSGRVVPGYSNRRTVEILVEAGFSVPDAIKICTLNGATYLEQQDEIGTIEAGKKADLVLINGDLSSDIKDIRKTETVFKDGVGFDSAKLFESVRGKVGLY
ncbi:MAG: amidohydrolase family protein, partial [Gillisia sp.]